MTKSRNLFIGDYQGLLPAFGSTCYSSLGWTPETVSASG